MMYNYNKSVNYTLEGVRREISSRISYIYNHISPAHGKFLDTAKWYMLKLLTLTSVKSMSHHDHCTFVYEFTKDKIPQTFISGNR